MSLLIVGSVAYDSIKTPHGEAESVLGGSAVYSAVAASLFAPPRLVGVVGEDFDSADVGFLQQMGIETSGLEVITGGKTFRWTGEYEANMNNRRTLSVELNVLADFRPKIPESFRDSKYVFLGNGAPVTQLSVLDQVDAPDFVMADTMDLWIQTTHEDLLRLLQRLDGVLLNDSEALLLTDTGNVMEAGREILKMGPQLVVVKKGEHGALLFTQGAINPLPAYPITRVWDPTGAGDSFAGGLMGHLARRKSSEPRVFKEALAYGTVTASFTVEEFGLNRLANVSSDELGERFDGYRDCLRF